MTKELRNIFEKVVSKLTPARRWRRKNVAWISKWVFASLFVAVLTPKTAISQPEGSAWHPVGEIAATAEAYLRDRAGVFDGNTTVSAGVLDSRHRLALCDRDLQGFLRSGTEIQARTIVGVRCDGSKPWKLYVPVNVIVTTNVLVARHTLTRGQLLSADDLTVELRDVSRIRTGYLTQAEQVVGQRLKTQLIAGKMLTPSMIEIDAVIRRGQSVTLVVGTGKFSISMNGTALMDGALNQRIRVQNINSGRIVEGVVRSQEHVEILLSGRTSNAQPGDPQFFHAEPKVSPKLADTGFSNNDR